MNSQFQSIMKRAYILLGPIKINRTFRNSTLQDKEQAKLLALKTSILTNGSGRKRQFQLISQQQVIPWRIDKHKYLVPNLPWLGTLKIIKSKNKAPKFPPQKGKENDEQSSTKKDRIYFLEWINNYFHLLKMTKRHRRESTNTASFELDLDLRTRQPLFRENQQALLYGKAGAWKHHFPTTLYSTRKVLFSKAKIS